MEEEFKVVENTDVINRMYNQKDGTFGVKDEDVDAKGGEDE